jgi:hypothetical protein
MDKKRLMEIRETLSNGDHLTRLDRAHLLALIDAELARQSVTDEAVQRALSELGFETLFELESWWCKHGSLAITALRQMKPSK